MLITYNVLTHFHDGNTIHYRKYPAHPSPSKPHATEATANVITKHQAAKKCTAVYQSKKNRLTSLWMMN